MSESLFTYTRRVRLKGKKFNGLFRIEDEDRDEHDQEDDDDEDRLHEMYQESGSEEELGDQDEDCFKMAHRSDGLGHQKSNKHGNNWKKMRTGRISSIRRRSYATMHFSTGNAKLRSVTLTTTKRRSRRKELR